MRESFHYPLSIFREAILSLLGWMAVIFLTTVGGIILGSLLANFADGTRLLVWCARLGTSHGGVFVIMNLMATAGVFALGAQSESLSERVSLALTNLITWFLVAACILTPAFFQALAA